MKNSNITPTKDHLSKITRDFINSCNGDRQKRIRQIQGESWIGYGNAKSIIERIQDMVERPRVTRMHSLLIIGSTDNGKSSIRKRIERNNERFATESGKMNFPVVSIQMPPTPDERGFYNALLKGMMRPTYISGKVDFIRDMVIDNMQDLNVKLLMIDEVQHIDRMPYRKQRAILDAVKYISNEVQLPIAAFGTEEAMNVFTSDPQLNNRFKKVFLPRWEANDDLRRLLASLEQLLPLENPSELFEQDLANHIYYKTNGTIGEICTLVRDSAIVAISSGEEKITREIIDGLSFESSKAEAI
jgi:hypothetical protein